MSLITSTQSQGSSQSRLQATWDDLSARLTQGRAAKMERTAAGRTHHLSLVVQDVHDPHNISACLRTAEALGIYNVFIVDEHSNYKPSTVARGVHKWLNISVFPSVRACAEALHHQGYKLACAYPDAERTVYPLGDIPIQQKLAVVFGNEHAGLDLGWDSHIDYAFTIPMVGMVESLNISVSAAVSMYDLRRRCLSELSEDTYFLSKDEQLQLRIGWAKSHLNLLG